MIDQLRELEEGEIEHVSGGVCTCGAGAGSVTSQTTTLTDSTIMVIWYNCSHQPVLAAFL